MSQFVESPTKTFAASSAIGVNLRVKVSAGVLALAGSTDVEIGTTDRPVVSGDEFGTVRLRTAQDTRKMVAAGAITANNPVYAAASGKVDASGTVFCGTALEAATANGDVIEILPGPNTDLSTAVAGTTAATFLVDNDSSTPKIELAAQTGGTGNFKASIKPPATLTGNRVFTLDGDADATIANLDTAQSLTNKTIGAGTNLTIGGSTAAAGSTTSDATVLPAATAPVYPTTAADDTKGVRIHANDKVTGRLLLIGNGVANKILKVYPPSGGTINGGSADAAFSSASGKGVQIVCLSSGSNTWLAW